MALAENCPGAPRWSVTTWQQVLDAAAKGEQRYVLVAESEEGFAGLGAARITGDEAEIESVAVSSAARRKGIGRGICEELMRWAKMRGASKVLLEVRVSNHAARALYESLGFHEIAIRKGYYRDPDEDGLVMAREL
jgi:ribosomal-protein-alanine N-acetyltransferase